MQYSLYIVFPLSVAVLTAGCGGSGGGSDTDSAVSDTTVSRGPGSAPDSSTIVDGCEVEAYQAKLLELVNVARSEARMCGDASFPASEPLTYSCALEPAAEVHSLDMASNNFFSHIGSDGLRVSHRVTAAGYPWQVVGENIAAGYDTPASVTEAWLASPGHCRNIMDSRFTDFAAARVDAADADFTDYWTQVFAKPR